MNIRRKKKKASYLNSEVIFPGMQCLESFRDVDIHHVCTCLHECIYQWSGTITEQPTQYSPSLCMVGTVPFFLGWAGAKWDNQEAVVVHWFYREEVWVFFKDLFGYFSHCNQSLESKVIRYTCFSAFCFSLKSRLIIPDYLLLILHR